MSSFEIGNVKNNLILARATKVAVSVVKVAVHINPDYVNLHVG